ncbi:MAG: PKD domain-containing protein [Bacteroidota bacterium]
MRSLYRFLAGFFLCCLVANSAQATHIVGGEMNYTCLGNDQYEITLTVFRDCFNGAPGAFFDDPAAIGVFDGQTNELVQSILIPWDPVLNDTLDPVLSSECFVAPPNVCVHTTTYTTIVTLPPQIGGYQLAYQRCCRNVTISNIVGPLDTGATFGVFISEKALLECNTNAQFQEWPPLYICVNEPINFSQAAFEPDGDSIVYKMCTPLEGASPANPQPQPPNNPPYQEITWIDPPYNIDNMLNGTTGGDPLTIDPVTGLLTGTPNTIGQFVVGVCVDEFRDGELISTTRRDFQYNVGECGQTTSAFFVPDLECDLTVDFTNQSTNANDFEWYFDIINDPTAVGSATNPTYTYPDSGTYTIMLIAEPNSECADTTFEQVNVQYNSLVPSFFYTNDECSDSLVIQMQNTSFDSIYSITDYEWVTSNGQMSDLAEPIFVFPETGNYIVTLTITNEIGCEQSFPAIIPVELIEEELPADTLFLCPGDSIELNPLFDDQYGYLWNPTATLNDSTLANPTASPDSTTTYGVTIIDSADCSIVREITVLVPEIIEIDAGPDTTTCEPSVIVFAQSDQAQSYQWALDPDINIIISVVDSALVTPFGETDYYVQATDPFGCTARDTVTVNGIGVNTQIDSLFFICLGDSLEIALQNLDADDVLVYNWEPDSLIWAGDSTATPTIFPEEPGNFTLYVESTNQNGCTWEDSVSLAVVDTLDAQSFVYFTQCSGTSVQFFNDDDLAPFYIWNFGDPTDPTASSTLPNPYYTYPDTGWYTVTLSLPPFLPCPDTAMIDIYVGPPEINVDFTYEYESCSDTVVIQFQDVSSNNQSLFLDRLWDFTPGGASTLPNPQIILSESTNLEVSLILSSDDGCVDTLTQILEIALIDEVLDDTITACNGAPVSLNPDFDPSYSYEWFPATGLDDPTSPNPMASPTETTVYTAMISSFSPDTCSIEQMITVIVPPPILYEATPDTVACENDVLITTISDQAVNYQWSDQDDFGTILSGLPDLTVDPNPTNTYYFQLTDAFGCSVVDSITVSNFGFELIGDLETTVCIRDTVSLSVSADNLTELVDVTWTPGIDLISGQGTSTVIVSPTGDQTFDVVATNVHGCQATTTALINIFDFTPPLFATATPDTILQGESSQLLATEDLGYSYNWTPSESLDNPTILDPVATPDTTTTYTVYVENNDGCSNEVEVRVVVIDPLCIEPYLFIPQAFSPNGDGKNDVFRPRGNFIDEVYLIVYDRWGEKVFETRDPNGGWDGTYLGQRLTPDVYGYYLEINCLGGEVYIKKGNVSLLK